MLVLGRVDDFCFFVAMWSLGRGDLSKQIYIYRYISGQIIATSHDLGPQKVAEKGKFPYFREI